MNKSKKLNASCLKIFRLINLLYEDKADYNSVVEIFKDEINEPSTNNIQVSLNKYINTLKVFGIKVKKENNRYKLLSSLYTMNFTFNDLKSISILLSFLKNFPNESTAIEIEEFIKSIELRMNSNNKVVLNNLIQTLNYDFSFYFDDLRNKIEKCENICNNNFLVNVVFKKNSEEIKCKCTPKEVIYDSKTAYLKIYSSQSREYIEIPINNIISIQELPQVANPIEMSTTVVYKLKNRLAKTYKIKENEYSDGFDDNGNLIIINKNENKSKLLQRLMRYSFNCEIISPKSLKEEMIRTINQTLQKYEE